MKTKLSALAASAALIAVFGCSSPPTTIEKAEGVNLGKYKTYMWVTQNEVDGLRLQEPKVDFIVGSAEVQRRPDIETQVRDLIDRGLQRQGFAVATNGKPDFYVTFYRKSPNQNWVSTWNGYTRAINDTPLVIFPGYDRDLANRARDGDFYVTFYDPVTQGPTWSGRVAITDEGPKLGTIEADQAIASLITEFKKGAA